MNGVTWKVGAGSVVALILVFAIFPEAMGHAAGRLVGGILYVFLLGVFVLAIASVLYVSFLAVQKNWMPWWALGFVLFTIVLSIIPLAQSGFIPGFGSNERPSDTNPERLSNERSSE